jgi:O-antigen/teichoic acid export membrane protein
MNQIQRIGKNISVLFFAQVISYILAFFYTIYAARYLGVSGFGILSFALAFTMIFAVMADLGLSTLLVRDVSRDNLILRKYLGNMALMKGIIALLTFISIVLIINLLNYPAQTVQVVYLIGIFIILTSFSQFFYSVFQAHEKMEYQSIGAIFSSIFIFCGFLIAIYLNLDVVTFALVYAISGVLVLLYSLLVCAWKFHWPQLEIDWKFWKFTLKTALPLSMAMVFSTIAFRIDTVLLSLLQGNTAVGFYSAPYKLIELLMFLPMIYTTSILPVMSNNFKSSFGSVKKVYERSFKYFIILGIPIAGLSTVLASKIILLLYGTAYLPSVPALQILIWTVPIIFLTYLWGTLFISIDRQDLVLKITFISMVFNIVLNLLLIPVYGFMGAALATVLTEVLAFIFLYHYSSILICKINLKSYIFKPVLATIIVCFLALKFDLNIFIVIIISLILYLVLLIGFKTFSKQDIDIFKKLINREGGIRK